MRKLALLVTGLAAIGSIGACSQSPDVPAISAPPVELRVRVSDSVLVFGKIDTIRVIIKNTLTIAIRLPFSTQCQDRVFIRNSANNVVLPASGSYVCAPVTSQLNIAAGDSVVRLYEWTGGQTFLPPDPSAKLPTGRYLVSATLQATDYSVDAFPVAIRLATSR
ncbi:MAG: BsuPI-related putative proteinase inhibitor [Gemmatimonadaceae bacterium]